MLESQAILLKRYPLSEHGSLAVMLTDNAGLIRVATRGSRKNSDLSMGLLDLFYLTEIQWVRSTKSNLHTLKSVNLISPFAGIKADYDKLRLTAYFSRLLLSLLEEESAIPEIFDLLLRALRYLDNNSASQKALLHFERELVRLLGAQGASTPPHITLTEQFGHRPLPLRAELLNQLPR